MARIEKYSAIDCTGLTLLGVDPADLSGGEIVGSCFAQEAPYKADASHARSTGHASPLVKVFPTGMHDVTFINCNLDNCLIEGRGVVIGDGCCHRTIRVMNDGDDWELDEATHAPTRPAAYQEHAKLRQNVDPANIPKRKRKGRSRLHDAITADIKRKREAIR